MDVFKKRLKMRNKELFTTSCIWYILFYFLFCHILPIFLNFQLLVKMLNFIFIEVTWKLGYLRWLHFLQEKWLRGHTSCLHAKWLICFGMWWQIFPQRMWVIGRRVPQDHENKVSRLSEIFMINKTQLKSRNHQFPMLQISTVCQEN